MSAAIHLWLKSLKKQLEDKSGHRVTVSIRVGCDADREVEWVAFVYFRAHNPDLGEVPHAEVFPPTAAHSVDDLMTAGLKYLAEFRAENIAA